MTDRYRRRKEASVCGVGFLAAVTALATGCGSSNGVAPVSSLPAPSPVTNTSSFVGSQYPDVWTFTTDDTQKAFTYQNEAASSAPSSGNFESINGMLDLGNSGGVPLGKAVEHADRAAMLRPGDNTAFPIPMIEQSDCFALNGKLRYTYASFPGQGVQTSGNSTSVGYGTFVVSTSSDGTWNFEDVRSYGLSSLSGSGAENGTAPEVFPATCSTKNGASTIAVGSGAYFASNTAAPTFSFHPAGTFVETGTPDYPWFGFVMPSSAISATSVVSGAYSGFLYESTNLNSIHTQPVAFTISTGSGNAITGGVFPNDDLTQTPGAEYTIILGQQDSVLNGIFPNARFIAQDVNGTCNVVAQNTPSVQAGFDANGNAICTAAGVAVIGLVDGKYVLYFTSIDGTLNPPGSSGVSAYVIQFYLYQQ